MIKRNLTLTLVVCLLATPVFASIDGAWTAAADEKRNDRFYINITRGRNHNMGTTMRFSDFTALTREQVEAAAMTPVQFELRREAGTAAFEGSFRKGKGAGQLSFTGNRAYIAAVRALGVEFDLEGKHNRHNRSEDEDLFTLALHDVSTTFIKSMQAAGFRESLETYLTLRIFDVTPEYVREMRALGFSALDAEEIVASKIHKVTPEYVRQMRAAGWNLSFDELQSSSIHGATPQFAAEMHRLGYKLDFDDLLSFRIHKVTAAFIQELAKLGYRNVDADDLVAMRIHKVTPEFIREIQAAGYKNVPVEKLVTMRIHKIDAQYLKKMGSRNAREVVYGDRHPQLRRHHASLTPTPHPASPPSPLCGGEKATFGRGTCETHELQAPSPYRGLIAVGRRWRSRMRGDLATTGLIRSYVDITVAYRQTLVSHLRLLIRASISSPSTLVRDPLTAHHRQSTYFTDTPATYRMSPPP